MWWARMFVAAAVFNLIFGGPILLAPAWSYSVAYLPPIAGDSGMTLRFWSDFGFAVVLIGAGYYLVARDLDHNRGLVWVGVFAKLFDVVTLTSRFVQGLARPVVLLPAAVDGLFVILFVLFLYKTRVSDTSEQAADGGRSRIYSRPSSRQ